MTDDAEDLRATIDDILADAERLRTIEERKGELEPGEAALTELAAEAERLVADLPAKAEAQSLLVERIVHGEARNRRDDRQS